MFEILKRMSARVDAACREEPLLKNNLADYDGFHFCMTQLQV